jgi:anti-sigma B factor antagonist
MTIQVENHDHITIVAFNQPTIEADNVPDLWADIEKVLAETSSLIIDLSQVDFIDSTGCGIFPNCIKRLGQKDGELKICGLSPNLAALFRLMAFDKLMDIKETRDTALAAFDD